MQNSDVSQITIVAPIVRFSPVKSRRSRASAFLRHDLVEQPCRDVRMGSEFALDFCNRSRVVRIPVVEAQDRQRRASAYRRI